MSVYKIIELVGSSPKSWEDATNQALTEARKTLRNLRVAEVSTFDVTLKDNGDVDQYRTKLRVSFKREPS